MKASTPSRIPHLARAIIEKRQAHLGRSNLCCHPDSARQHGLSLRNLQNTRFYASSTRPSRRREDDLNKHGPQRPHRLRNEPFRRPPAEQRPPFAEQPTTPAWPTYKFEPGEDYGKYNPDKDPVKIRRYRAAKFGFIMVLTGFVAYVYQSYQNDLLRYYAKGEVLPQDADVTSRWKDATRNFDREVDAAERFMGMKWKRKRLVREAYGDVLEVSVGTGRNMDLYDTRPYGDAEDATYGRDLRNMITSLTFNDVSPVMIENAKKKWDKEQKKRRVPDRFTGQVNWYTGDAGDRSVIPRPAGGYDTIVQSWGICSMADPIKFLRHLGRLVRQPDEKIVNASPAGLREREEEDGKGGRIFLLEHGRGNYEWLNNFLDRSAPMHADRYGCWYNKDIDKVIEDSGLVVERVRRYNFGTTYEYILRPAPGLLPGEEDMNGTQSSPEDDQMTGGWFSKWWR